MKRAIAVYIVFSWTDKGIIGFASIGSSFEIGSAEYKKLNPIFLVYF